MWQNVQARCTVSLNIGEMARIPYLIHAANRNDSWCSLHEVRVLLLPVHWPDCILLQLNNALVPEVWWGTLELECHLGLNQVP